MSLRDALQCGLRHNDHDSDCLCGVPSLFCRMVEKRRAVPANRGTFKRQHVFWRLMNENKKVQLHRLQHLFDYLFDSLFDCLLVCRFVIGLLVCWFVSSFACLTSTALPKNFHTSSAPWVCCNILLRNMFDEDDDDDDDEHDNDKWQWHKYHDDNAHVTRIDKTYHDDHYDVHNVACNPSVYCLQ